MLRKFLLASDFDQTLSFNDSGVVLSELIGFHNFHDKVKGLADINLVQQGAEPSYLILHDPDFRRVRREHLVETGRRIRLKHDVALFARVLDNLGEEHKFNFNVVSAGPRRFCR
jgi:2-hydroxy-3-keto-5-methylthiopentenyl-1-phosphate phosphatase